MSIRVILEIKAAPGKSADLHKKFAEVLGDTRAFDGCESIELIQNQEDQDLLLLIESWKDLASYQAYKKWRTESGTSVAASSLVAEKRQLICDPLDT